MSPPAALLKSVISAFMSISGHRTVNEYSMSLSAGAVNFQQTLNAEKLLRSRRKN